MSTFVEWMQTPLGIVVSTGVIWLVLSIGFCFLLGGIARRLKRAPEKKSTPVPEYWADTPRRRQQPTIIAD